MGLGGARGGYRRGSIGHLSVRLESRYGSGTGSVCCVMFEMAMKGMEQRSDEEETARQRARVDGKAGSLSRFDLWRVIGTIFQKGAIRNVQLNVQNDQSWLYNRKKIRVR